MTSPPQLPEADDPGRRKGVTITDVDIPFTRLVVIILKTMLASIPAVIVMYALLAAVGIGLVIVFGGLGVVLENLQQGRLRH
ncbi:MAG: hypothetical protein CJBNEKGG_00787 [Prosthecobacter sp.]|nr:hypothetical protein [Prosthecobacter sp.]